MCRCLVVAAATLGLSAQVPSIPATCDDGVMTGPLAKSQGHLLPKTSESRVTTMIRACNALLDFLCLCVHRCGAPWHEVADGLGVLLPNGSCGHADSCRLARHNWTPTYSLPDSRPVMHASKRVPACTTCMMAHSQRNNANRPLLNNRTTLCEAIFVQS